MAILQSMADAKAKPAADPADALADPAKAEAAPAGAEAGADGDTGQPQDNPVYQRAFNFALEALYGNGAAQEVAQAIRAASDPVEGLSETAYRMVEIVDEKTGGEVPDEDLIALAADILGEVAEIAQAAGIEVDGKTIAEAMRDMLIRYVTEQGLDPAQLQQAMGQVDTAALGAALDKQGA